MLLWCVVNTDEGALDFFYGPRAVKHLSDPTLKSKLPLATKST